MVKEKVQSDDHAKDVEQEVDVDAAAKKAAEAQETPEMSGIVAQFLAYLEKDKKDGKPKKRVLSDEYLKELAFMAEYVEVRVHESPDEFAELVIPVFVNGIPCVFPRGTTVRCPRFLANALIVRGDVVTTPSVMVEGPDGSMEKSYGIKTRSSHKYPFEVVKDSAKGKEWFKRRLAEVV